MTVHLDPLTFPLHGIRLIEASAGTGKTYTIAALYLRLVLGHGDGLKRPLTPPEILVVTFTNAATQELRERIRTRLTEAAACFRGVGDGDTFLRDLRADHPQDTWPAMALRLDRAAQWMDESAIHTIHGWCQRMLLQHAFDSLSLFDLELAPDDGDLLEEAACDYWRIRFYSLEPEVLSALVSATDISTPQDLLARAMPLIRGVVSGGVPKVTDPFDLMAARQASVETARLAWASDFQAAVDRVDRAQKDKTLNNNRYRRASLERWIREMDLWVNLKGPLPDDQTLEKMSASGLAQGTAKAKTPPDHPAFHALDRLNRTLGGMDLKTALVTHAAADIRKRVETAKTRLSRLGFDDLLIRMDQALSRPGGDRLARIISEQFPVAMIDEFQDTDPVQYRSFSAIYLNRPKTGLFMIGDPKQAIYGFRGADIHTYLAARRDTSGNHYTLDKNYRSSRGMVAAVNRIFSRAETFAQGPFLFRDEIPFEPVSANGRDDVLIADGRETAAMTLWQLDQTEPVSKTGANGYLSCMAEAAACEIARLIGLGASGRAGCLGPDQVLVPLKPSHIAVLVRDGGEARMIRRALAGLRIRSAYLSDRESVFDSPEALFLLDLLRACADPADAGRVRTALAVPMLGFSLEDLDRLNRDEAFFETEIHRFKTFQAIWQTRGVLPMVRALVARFDVGARLLATPAGERSLTNLLHLAEMLQAAEGSLDGEQGLIRWLAGQIEQPQGSADDRILRLESDDDLVRVVTIHKSKGLEYPLVFLPFVCSFRRLTSQNAPVVTYHEDDGIVRQAVNPDRDALAKADRERLAEDLRLLYVALTRACHACWLGIGVLGRTNKKKGEVSELHHSAIGYLLGGGAEVKTGGLKSLLGALQDGCGHIDLAPLPVPAGPRAGADPSQSPLAPARDFRGRVPRDWRITSYSGMLAGAALHGADPIHAGGQDHGDGGPAIGETVSPDSAVQDQLIEGEFEQGLDPVVRQSARSIHTFARGPAPGTFLHDVLEWAAGFGFHRVASDRNCVRDTLDTLCARRGWPDWAGVLADWLQALVIQDMGRGSPAMTLADLTPDLCRAEMEFMFAANGLDVSELDCRVSAGLLPGGERPRLRPDRIRGMLKGFIDLVFCHNKRYFVLDYKSNHLGDSGAAYGRENMARAMLAHRYDLQYALYTLALHRLLKIRLPDYDYDRHVGGAIYLFLRGAGEPGRGVYRDKPPKSLILEMDRLFLERRAP